MSFKLKLNTRPNMTPKLQLLIHNLTKLAKRLSLCDAQLFCFLRNTQAAIFTRSNQTRYKGLVTDFLFLLSEIFYLK